MILAFLVFGFGVAQVLVQRDVFSRDTKFYIAIAAISLSALPLGIQFVVLLVELSHIPKKFWIKLLLHRLVMGILGDNGQAANLAANYFRHSMRWGFIGKNLSLHACVPQVVRDVLDCLFPLSLPVALSACIVIFIIHVAAYVIANVMGLLIAKLLGAALFKDAFSVMYHMKNVSLAVSLEEEQNVKSFYDSRGRKVTSTWDYPYVLEAARPMILRDLDVRRMELLKRLKEPPEQAESFDWNVKIESFLEREEDLRWEVLEKNERNELFWKELFKREEALRWYVLSGKELTQELFVLEKIKLQVARLEFEELQELRQLRKAEQFEQHAGHPGQKSEPLGQQSRQHGQQLGQPEQHSELIGQNSGLLGQLFGQRGQQLGQCGEQFGQCGEQSGQPEQQSGQLSQQSGQLQWPLKADLLTLLQQKRERQLEQVAQLESEQLTQMESRLRLKQKAGAVKNAQWLQEQIRFYSEKPHHRYAGRGAFVSTESYDRKQRVKLECRLQEAQVELKQMEEGQVKPMDRRWRRKQLRPLKAQKMNKLQSLMETKHHELPYELQDEQLSVTKVVRSMRLEVVFLPSYTSKRISYFITATGSQDSYLSKLYLEEFSGYCRAANAAEFLKLMEILDDDTFVVKRQAENPLLLEVDGLYKLGKQEKIFSLPCENLKHIVTSILDDGKTLDAIHVKSVSYV